MSSSETKSDTKSATPSDAKPNRTTGTAQIGVTGLAVMGSNIARNFARNGHTVAVYERADRIGGLLRYGIPEFKMEKRHLSRRLVQMEAEFLRTRGLLAAVTAES